MKSSYSYRIAEKILVLKEECYGERSYRSIEFSILTGPIRDLMRFFRGEQNWRCWRLGRMASSHGDEHWRS